jgi:hypothetical protein
MFLEGVFMKIIGGLLILAGLLIVIFYSNYLRNEYFKKHMQNECNTTKYIYILTELVSFSPYTIAIGLILAGILMVLY